MPLDLLVSLKDVNHICTAVTHCTAVEGKSNPFVHKETNSAGNEHKVADLASCFKEDCCEGSLSQWASKLSLKNAALLTQWHIKVCEVCEHGKHRDEVVEV